MPKKKRRLTTSTRVRIQRSARVKKSLKKAVRKTGKGSAVKSRAAAAKAKSAKKKSANKNPATRAKPAIKKSAGSVAAIRRAMRRARRDLTPGQQRHAARAIARRLARLPLLNRSRHIGCYIAADGEIDPAPFIATLWRRKKLCYLPVLQNRNRLNFAHYTKETKLERNRFRIPEPVQHRPIVQMKSRLDLVFTPLVAFDANGNRIGMGAGFYDRSFAYLRRRTLWRRPKLVGLAHDFQRVAKLPAQPWDVPLNGVVTDRAWYDTSKRNHK